MSIFSEMFSQAKFESLRDFTELLRMLGEAMERGYVEEIPVSLTKEVAQIEHWYKDKETGEVYSLIPPEAAARGYWGPISLEQYQMTARGPQ